MPKSPKDAGNETKELSASGSVKDELPPINSSTVETKPTTSVTASGWKPPGIDNTLATLATKDSASTSAGKEPEKHAGAAGKEAAGAEGDVDELVDDQGRAYYYNRKSRMTAWSKEEVLYEGIALLCCMMSSAT